MSPAGREFGFFLQKSSFRNTISVIEFEPNKPKVCLDLGPNSLQWLSAHVCFKRWFESVKTSSK